MELSSGSSSMIVPVPVTRERVATAIYLVVQDTKDEFDECLFDRLIESSSPYLKLNTSVAKKLISLYQIYGLHGSQQINTFRLLKTHAGFVTANKDQLGMLNSVMMLGSFFLEKLPSIIKRNNLSEVTAALKLISTLNYDILHYLGRERFHLVMGPHYCSPKYGDSDADQNAANQSERYEITSIIQLIRYYMVTSRNYNILKMTMAVLQNYLLCLATNSRPRETVEELKQILEELILVVRTPIVYEFLDMLHHHGPSLYSNTELFQHIKSLLGKAFEQACQQPPPASVLNSLAASLGMANFPSNEIVPKLKELNSLDAIIMFAENVNVFKDLQLSHTIFYPILMQCDSDEAHELAGRQFMTRMEKYFIERNSKDKHVLKCLLYLKNVISGSHRDLPNISYKRLIYILDVALEYLRSNYESPKAMKNLLECCSILAVGQEKFTNKKDYNWSFYLVHHLNILASRTDLEAKPYMKSVFLQLIQLLSTSHYYTSVFKTSYKVERVMKHWFSTIKLAYRHKDLDVLYEISRMFHLTRNELTEAKDHQMEQYVGLITEHMLPMARQQEHHDLLAVLVSLLIRIDMDVKASILEKFHMVRHQTVPIIIATLLMEFVLVRSLTERILFTLNDEDKEDLNDPPSKVGYLEWLDVNVALAYKKAPLDHLLQAVCHAMRGECASGPKQEALIAINSLIESFLITEDDPDKIFTRLFHTGLLEMIYMLCNCPLQTRQVRSFAIEKVDRIYKHVIKKLGSKMDAIEKLTQLISNRLKTTDPENEAQQQLLRDQAAMILGFYEIINANKSLKGDLNPLPENGNNQLGLESYLNDILDYRRTDWGPSECY